MGNCVHASRSDDNGGTFAGVQPHASRSTSKVAHSGASASAAALPALSSDMLTTASSAAVDDEGGSTDTDAHAHTNDISQSEQHLEEISEHSDSSSLADNVDDSDDDASDDDTADLTESEQRAIDEETASYCIVHSVPLKRVRGILMTSNEARGVTRTLSPAAMALRKKGLRWTVAEATWSVHAPLSQPIMQRLVAPPTASLGSVENSGAASSGSPKLRGLGSPKIAGEKWIGPRRRSSSEQPSGGSSSSSPQVEGPLGQPMPKSSPMFVRDVSASPQQQSYTRLLSSPSVSTSTLIANTASPRQYTSSARLAGSMSSRARQGQAQAGNNSSSSSSSHFLSDPPLSTSTAPAPPTSLTHALQSTLNLLLKLNVSQLESLQPAALQQLFLLYSKAARNVRERCAEKEKAAGGHRHMRSGSFSLANPPLTAEQSFLLGAGVVSLTPTPTLPHWAQAHHFVDLAGDVALSSEETHLLSLHLVQCKLACFAHQLARQPEVMHGKAKLTTLLNTRRWALFPGAIAAAGGADTATTTPAAPLQPTSTPASAAHSSSPSSPFVGAASAAPVSLPPLASSLSESSITELFVRCTTACLCARLRTNNFGELVWGGWIDALPAKAGSLAIPAALSSTTGTSSGGTHVMVRSNTTAAGVPTDSSSMGVSTMSNSWSRFIAYYFAFHASTNPQGLSGEALAEQQRKQNAPSSSCTIM